MRWTDKQPDREGWWWCKARKHYDPSVVRVQFYPSDNVWGWVDSFELDCGALDDFDLWSDEPVQEPEDG